MKRFKYPLYALLLLIPTLGMSFVAMSTPAFASYACGTPNDTNPHCYGKFDEYSNNSVDAGTTAKYTWANNFTGAYTYQDVVQPTSTDIYGQYNNEMWFADDNVVTDPALGSHFCFLNYNASTHTYSNTYSLCWVETGYQYVGTGYGGNPNNGKVAWFVSYDLPWDGYVAGSHGPYCDNNSPFTGSCGYGNLYGGQVSASDYGNFGDFEILFDAVNAHQMDTYADGIATSYDKTISNVYLNPTQIQEGTELGGTSGTSAPKTHMKHNEFEVGTSWYYQNLDGQIDLTPSTSNLKAGWQTGGSYKPSNNTTGGIFDTCDQSGCAP